MYYTILVVTVLFSYLCGSIPTGYLIVKKLYGIDIRSKGSGNIGSTNVNRIVGRKISIITQIIDMLKGFIPMFICMKLSRIVKLPISTETYLSIIALAAILGHNYTAFLGFKGGKGVNTTLGVFVLIAPIPTICSVLIYFILRLFTSIVSIRSISLGMSIPIICAIMKFPLPIIIASIISAILMVMRHKDNLIRLVKKEEK